MIVAMAVGGSTNVMLHAPEIARAAGYRDFYKDIMSVEKFNHLSTEIVPVIVNARPFGYYSMVDIDEKGCSSFCERFIEAGLLNGKTLTCTGMSLSDQIQELNPPRPDGEVIYSVKILSNPLVG